MQTPASAPFGPLADSDERAGFILTLPSEATS